MAGWSLCDVIGQLGRANLQVALPMAVTMTLVLCQPSLSRATDQDPARTGAALRSDRAEAVRVPLSKRPRPLTLDRRIELLTKELDLNEAQQTEVRKLLLSQRDQVTRLWNDTSVPAPYRVNATQAISEQTADRIRALLDDKQRKRYNSPKPAHLPPADPSQRTVEDWMQAVNAK
jgi:hypothetical protein